jgi:hypothetical protein
MQPDGRDVDCTYIRLTATAASSAAARARSCLFMTTYLRKGSGPGEG